MIKAIDSRINGFLFLPFVCEIHIKIEDKQKVQPIDNQLITLES